MKWWALSKRLRVLYMILSCAESVVCIRMNRSNNSIWLSVVYKYRTVSHPDLMGEYRILTLTTCERIWIVIVISVPFTNEFKYPLYKQDRFCVDGCTILKSGRITVLIMCTLRVFNWSPESVNYTDHGRVSGIEPSSVILRQTKFYWTKNSMQMPNIIRVKGNKGYCWSIV